MIQQTTHNITENKIQDEGGLHQRINLTILECKGYNIEIDTVIRESTYIRITQKIIGVDKSEVTGLILIRNEEINNLIVKLLEYKTKGGVS